MTEMRPYQLRGPRYALWFDCGILGINGQVAVENYLCRGSRMITPQGKRLDERSRLIVSTLAKKRGVLIPETAY